MIYFLRGRLAAAEADYAVIDVNGIGYKVNIPANSSIWLKKPGDEITVHTHMAVREDEVSLYGFEDSSYLDLFRKLTSVSGVGAKAAMAIFSALEKDEIVNAIILEDAAVLTKANGIGKKTAQRIVLELKDRFEADRDLNLMLATGQNKGIISGNAPEGRIRDEAVSALMELGFTRAEACERVDAVKDAETVEQLIRQALTV